MDGTSNFLINKINRKVALSLDYKGVVIDLGCGMCPYKKDILKVADHYIGVDWENSIHDQSNVDVFADLAKPLPFPDEYADTVVSFQVMEHLPEPGLFLKESRRILKRGGEIFLTAPFMWHVHEAPHDYFRFTRYGLKYLLEKTGFMDIKISENTGFWQTWVLKFNYHTVRFARGPLKYFWVPLW
jgi:SAM-dependent methyltransferase